MKKIETGNRVKNIIGYRKDRVTLFVAHRVTSYIAYLVSSRVESFVVSRVFSRVTYFVNAQVGIDNKKFKKLKLKQTKPKQVS
jgi:hypothetical protein